MESQKKSPSTRLSLAKAIPIASIGVIRTCIRTTRGTQVWSVSPDEAYRIIKGWPDSNGEMQEQIVDVACSDGRAIGPDNRCERSVGSTVDVADANYTNSKAMRS